LSWSKEKGQDGVCGDELLLPWNQIASLIAAKQPKSYDRVVELLMDL